MRPLPVLIRVQALAIALAATTWLFPGPVRACGGDTTDVKAGAEQAITWASALVQWHERRRVAPAAPANREVLELQEEALIALTAARSQYAAGRFEGALAHAQHVEIMLDR